MTDRVSAYVVVLEKDLREDDAQATRDAIYQLRGVLSVSPILNQEPEVHIATMRLKNALLEKILAIFNEL